MAKYGQLGNGLEFYDQGLVWNRARLEPAPTKEMISEDAKRSITYAEDFINALKKFIYESETQKLK